MRFILPELDISISVSLSDVIDETKAVSHMKAHHMNLWLSGYALYTKRLEDFDCGGRSIGEDWVRHVSYSTYQTYTHTFMNTSGIINGIYAAYQEEIQTHDVPRQRIQKELITRRRVEFVPGDLLMYTTTISHASISKRYLMHVILE